MAAPDFKDGRVLVKPGESGPEEYDVYIEIFDGKGNFLGEVGDYTSASVTWTSEAEATDSSSFVVPSPSYWSRHLMRANLELILVRIVVERAGKQVRKWTGRIERSVRKNEGGEATVTCELIHDKAWLSYLWAWPSPFANINTQLPKHDVITGPAIYCLKKYFLKAVLRFNTDNLPKERKRWLLYNWKGDTLSNYMDDSSKQAEALKCMDPFIVVPTAFNRDTSPSVTLTARMDSMASIWQDVCKDFDLLPVIETYYPGRDPLPEGVSPTGRTTPSIIVNIIDKNKARAAKAPMGTIARHFDVASQFLQSIVGAFDTSVHVVKHDESSLGEFFGTKASDKWVIFRESSQHWRNTEVSAFAPTSVQTIAGGSSMEWINDTVKGSLMAAINFVLHWFGLDMALDAILGDKLKDVFFAFQRTRDEDMSNQLGPFAFYETYTGKGGTAYGLDAGQAIRSDRWSAIGYRTATFSGDSAAFPPFRIFEDFDLLDPIGWEDDEEGHTFTERLKGITMNVDRDGGVQFEIRLGESSRPEEPWSAQQRQNARFKQAINAAFDKE